MFLGELAALGTAVCWSFTAVFFSYSGSLIGSGNVNRSRLVFAFLFLTISHWFVMGQFFPTDAEPFRWFWLGISSILGLVLGDTFLFRAFVMLGPRLSTLMMSAVPIISTLFGWLLFGELVSRFELLGIIMAVGGIAWVVTEKQPDRTVVENKAYKQGLFFGLLGALGQVLNLVTARYGLVDDFPTISATVMRIFVALLILWSLAAVRGQFRSTLRHWKNRDAFPALLSGSIAGPFLGIWLSLVAIQHTRLGIASTLMALPPIILIPVEYIVYKKPVSRRGIIGTLFAFLGVSLIFLR